MTMQQVGTLPVEITRVGGIHPCNSCGIRTGKNRVRLKIPGGRRSEYKFCDKCTEQFR